MILLNSFDWKPPTYTPCTIKILYRNIVYSRSFYEPNWCTQSSEDNPIDKPNTFVWVKDSTFDYSTKGVRVMKR